MTATVTHLLPAFWSVGTAAADLGGAWLSWRRGLEDEPTATVVHRVRAGADLAAVLETIRPAVAADWDELAGLFRADHVEEDEKAGRPVRAQVATDRVVAARRLLPAPVQYLVAVEDGIAGFVAGWPGEDGTGLVEDLFVRADDRGRRLATMLIARAVGRAARAAPGAW